MEIDAEVLVRRVEREAEGIERQEREHSNKEKQEAIDIVLV